VEWSWSGSHKIGPGKQKQNFIWISIYMYKSYIQKELTQQATAEKDSLPDCVWWNHCTITKTEHIITITDSTLYIPYRHHLSATCTQDFAVFAG